MGGNTPGILQARELVQIENISTLPVDLLGLAASRDIHVVEKDCDEGVSGMLIRHRERFAIVYARSPSAGFQRFSIAHELGHYFIQGHPEKLFREGDGTHQSSAGFVSTDSIEREADEFAAELLMPTALVQTVLARARDGMEAIEKLSEICITSLVASAIRYVGVTAAPAAIVVSHGGHVEFCFGSDELKEFRGLSLLRSSAAIPRGTLTEEFYRNPKWIAQAARRSGTNTLQDWFGYSRSTEVKEEVVGLGRYGRVLTVLVASGTADDDDEVPEWDKDGPRFTNR